MFDEERIRALRDRDALLLVLRQHEEGQKQLQHVEDYRLSEETKADSPSPVLEIEVGHLPRPEESDHSPLFTFQYDEEQQKTRSPTPEQHPVISKAEKHPAPVVVEGEEEETPSDTKDPPIWAAANELPPQRERAPKMPVLSRHLRHPSGPIAIQPRRVIMHPSSDSGDFGSSNEVETTLNNTVYSSSMPIQVPLLADDALDLRKRAKKALVKQAYGKSVVHTSRGLSTSSNPGFVALDGVELPDPPISQSFAVPSSLNIRNPFRPE